MDWYQICIDELDVEVKYGIKKTHQLYPTSYSMWQSQHISFHIFHIQKVLALKVPIFLYISSKLNTCNKM